MLVTGVFWGPVRRLVSLVAVVCSHLFTGDWGEKLPQVGCLFGDEAKHPNLQDVRGFLGLQKKGVPHWRFSLI